MIENITELRFMNVSDVISNGDCDERERNNCVKESCTEFKKLKSNSQSDPELSMRISPDNLVSTNLEIKVFGEFPLDICSLETLRSLSVAKSKIKFLPNEVGNLSNLEYLDCSENLLETLPSSLSNVSKLLVLNASKNDIMWIPDELQNLKKLEKVNLSHNKLIEVPVAILLGSKFISHLNLSYNCVQDFSKEPGCSASLKSFKMNNNNLVELPVWMRCLQGIEELFLGNNPFKNVLHRPFDHMMPLPSVTMAKLSINSCGLKNLPSSLNNMKNLIYLEAGNDRLAYKTVNTRINNIWDLKPCLSLRYLKELRLPSVGIPVLPDDFWTSLNNLEILYLESNNISWLPDGLSSNKYLTKLILSQNRLVMLPNEIGAVKSLQELRLDGNKLHELPDSIVNLHNLIYLDLYDNEILEFPPIGSLHSLQFLDLELNSFSIDKSSCKVFEEIPAEYVIMRENLRKRLLPTHNRFVGSKEPLSCNTPDDFSSSRDDEESDISSLHSDYQPDLKESVKNCTIGEEENWDQSDGSDNFFDPEYSKSLRDSVVKSQWHWARGNGRWEQPENSDIFCPADIHPELFTCSSMKEEPAVSDGQFDDVDDDLE